MEDDRPIGGGGPSATAFNFDQNPDAFQSSSKAPQPGTDAPLEERLKNKNWKIRSDAFDQLIKSFKSITNKRDPMFRDYSNFFQKYLQDSHPTSLQKAIDAVQIMSKYSEQSKSFTTEWIKPLVQKGLSHTKPAIKEKSCTAILTIAEESQKFRDIIQCLEQLLSNKVPKTQIAAVTAINELIHNFGTSVIQIKPFFPKMQNLSGHSNSLIRTGTITFYAECQRWLGSAVIEPLIDHLKATQKTELQKKVQQITANDTKPVRPLRFPASKRVQEQIKIAQQENKKQQDLGDEEAAPSAYDFAQEINPWAEFNQSWIEKVNSQEKWNQKVGMLDILTDKCNVTKLSPDNMGGVIPGLMKFASQTNVNISGAGIKAICNISKGTRVFFKPHAKSMLNILFQKYKQRKPALINAVRDTLESFHNCFDLGLLDVSDEVVALFKDKNPTIKANVLKWTSQITMKTYIDDLKSIAQQLLPQLSTLVNESNSQVRDACLSYLGVLKARLGEQALTNVLTNLNPSKASKVDQSASEVKKSKYDIPKKVAAPPKRAQKKGSFNNAKQKSKSKFQAPSSQADASQDKNGQVLSFSMGGGDQNANQGFKPPPALKRKKKPEQQKEQTKGPPQLSSGAATKKPAVSGTAGPPKKPIINIQDQVKGNNGPQPSKEQAQELASQLFDQETLANINQTKWKEKSLALEAILQWISQNTQVAQQNTQAVIIFIKSRLKDFKESNINLVKGWIAIVSKYAQVTTSVNKRTANMVMGALTQKIGDVKFKALVEECLFNLASILGQGFIAKLIVKYGSDAKSPNILKEVCNFLTKLPEEFATAIGLPLKEIIDFGKIVIANSNPGARTSATSLLVAYYQWCGEAARGLILKDIKQSTQKVVETELGKVQPHQPGAFQAKREFRGQAAQAQFEQSKQGGKKKGGTNAAAALLDEALPRQDIGSQLSKKLLKQFGESNWKPKKDACQKVQAILEGAGNRILPAGIGQLVGILKNMISAQSNKAVQKALFKLIGKLGFALGSAASKITGKFFPKLIDFLSNKNGDVRSQILKCMDCWGDAIGPQNLFSFFPQRLKNQSPELRCDLIAWILGIIGKQEDILSSSKIQLKPFIAPLLNCLGAKQGSVRGVAQKFMSHIATKIGTAPFYLVMKDLKQGVAKQIKPIIDRYQGLCPQPDNSFAKPLNKVKSVASIQQPAPALSTTPKLNKTQNKFQKRGGALIQNSGLSKTSSNFNTSPAPPSKIASNRGPSSGAVQRPPTSSSTTNLNQLQQNSQPLAINIGQREKRLALLRKCQFSMQQVRSDEIVKLKALALQTFGPQMEGLLFHKDFKKHIQAANTLASLCQTQPNDMRQVADIVIRWIYVRLIDHQSNTALVKSVIQLIKALITMHENCDIRLHDTEGKLLLASMIQKTGVNNITFRKDLKDLIFNCSSSIYSHTRVMAHLMGGLRSKNLKSTAECLDLISQMIQTFGIQIIGSSNSASSSFDKDLKEICKFLDSSDANVRNNALNVLADVYKHMRDDIWPSIQPLSAKQKDLMDARFKKLNLMAHSTSTHSLSGFGFSTGGGGARSKSPINQQSGIGMGNKGNKTMGAMNKTSFTPRMDKKQQPTNSLGLSARRNIHQTNQQQQQNLFQSAIQRPTTSIGNNYNSVGRVQQLDSQPQKMMQQQPQQKFQSSLNVNRQFQTPQQQYSSQASYQQQQQQQQQQQYNNTYDQRFTPNNGGTYLEQRPATSAGFYPPAQDKQEISGNAYMSQQQDSNLHSQANSTMQSLQICVNYLKFGETPEKEKALQSLNQIIIQNDNKLYLQTNINEIIQAFCAGMVHTFDRPLQQIPISFAKRFLHIVGKVASMRSVINELDQDQLMNFEEQLLRKLLIQGINQASNGGAGAAGDPSDGEKIVKNLNTTMLRLLENCNQTRVFSSLLRLMKKYCADQDHPKMAGLIIKCLLKLTKVLDKLIKELNIDKILLVIHEYLLAHPSSHRSHRSASNANTNQDLGTRIVKTIINELVKLKKTNIWNHYTVVAQHPTPDNHIQRWIKIILSQQNIGSQAGSVNFRQSIQSHSSQSSQNSYQNQPQMNQFEQQQQQQQLSQQQQLQYQQQQQQYQIQQQQQQYQQQLHQYQQQQQLQQQYQQKIQSQGSSNYSNPTIQLDRFLKTLKPQNSPSKQEREKVLNIRDYAQNHNLDLQAHLQKHGDQLSAFVNHLLLGQNNQEQNFGAAGEEAGIKIDLQNEIMSDRHIQMMKPRQAWGIKKDQKSHQSTSELPTYSNLTNLSSQFNPNQGGSTTPSSLSGFKQISELKAKWNKQNQIAAAAAASQQQQNPQQSLQSMRSMLSTSIGPTDIGSKTPKKLSQQDKLNSSFSNTSMNQTAKKWLDRKEQRQKSQDAQLVRPHKSSMLNSPGGGGDDAAAAGDGQNLEDFSGKLAYNQSKISSNLKYHHHAPDHKHHLSMTGYVGSSKLMLSQNHQESQVAPVTKPSISEIRSKLDKMKQQMCANKENSKGVLK